MSDRVRRALWLSAFLLFCSLGSILAAWQNRDAGDTLSAADPYSEANLLREVHNFLEHGIGAYDGLGNVIYPGLYPTEGFADHPELMAHTVTPEGVYTHYPPGPEYLAYVAAKLFGPSPVSRMRIVPLVFSWTAVLFFGLTLRQRFGALTGWLLMAACLTMPMFHDAETFLHAAGYAFALLLVEIALCLRPGRQLLPLALIGFVQGWMTFDYVFLVVLAPAAIALALPRMNLGETLDLRLAARRCLASAAGFTLAHLMHFAEVAAYFGSLPAALHDLAGAAALRAGAEQAGGILQHLRDVMLVLDYYYIDTLPAFWSSAQVTATNPHPWQALRFLGITPGSWWLVVTLALVGGSVWSARRSASAERSTLLGDWMFVSLCGFVPSALWLVVMVNHAIEHHHFLYRHLFFAFFLWLLFVVTAAGKRRRVAGDEARWGEIGQVRAHGTV